ncbi:zinc-containing alcohol dehydrogenase (ADH) [Tieghemostelium lacteum]|uniref:Zinc-containing alcohol dehydrogenase (ADH) n=1 Tax=Tieghemostelium lacteum TaxID=361077 RepID=A0A151ZG07_TIELA|nr:zinc-containing alcohol dehydrogenase (ADH) [Tieghemostelium lacteum]|eukprot:KYQ92800.1 zinc-containing alcohol dehydrogenase (ADH) [Tieghemostelium lacteum]
MEESFKNKTVVFDKFGGPEVLRVITKDIPEADGVHIRIKVKAIGFNRAEALYRNGLFVDVPREYPASLGLECSGIVDAIGDLVPKGRFKIGDSVSILPCLRQSDYSTYSEYVIFPYQCITLNPPEMSHTDASSVWLAYLTAYYGFNDVAQVKPGDYVVVTAASSSAGLAAIQLLKCTFKARVIAVSRTSKKKDKIIFYGAHHFISMEESPDLYEAISIVTGDEGVSIIYDCVGGDITNGLSKTLKKYGHYILYGLLNPTPTTFPILEAFIKYINFKGYIIFEYSTRPDKLAEGNMFLLEQFSKHQFKSIVGKKFQGIENVSEAHKYLELYDLFGKTVVEL